MKNSTVVTWQGDLKLALLPVLLSMPLTNRLAELLKQFDGCFDAASESKDKVSQTLRRRGLHYYTSCHFAAWRPKVSEKGGSSTVWRWWWMHPVSSTSLRAHVFRGLPSSPLIRRDGKEKPQAMRMSKRVLPHRRDTLWSFRPSAAQRLILERMIFGFSVPAKV